MSETTAKNAGPVALDVALREWPDAEKLTGERDDIATAVVERLRRGERGTTTTDLTDEQLLAEPLGQTPEDSHNSAATRGTGSVSPKPSREGKPMMSSDRERDRRSLQDLAKMAQGLTPPPPSVVPSAPSAASGVTRAAEAKADDSGLVDLAAASTADPGAAARAQTTPLAAQGLFDEEPARPAAAPAPVSSALSAAQASVAPGATTLPSQPAPSVAPPASAAVIALPQQEKKKSGGAGIALLLGGVVALSAAAAGGFLFLKSRAGAASAQATSTPAVVATQAPTAAAKAPEPTPAAEPAPAAEPTPDDKLALAAKPTAKGAAPVVAAPKAAAPAAKPEGPAKMTEKDLGPAAAGPGGDLGAAMKNVVGDDANKPVAAAATGGNTATGNVPQKPSQGAVTGAIGAVLPSARACLGPDDPVSRATVVFGSNGSAQSVSVSGGAAGKPAEACIKTALMKAKVQPFAEATYSAPITIRH